MADLRFAFTQLRKHPVFAAVAIVTLTLGIGANTVLFSIVHGVVIRALPYDNPHELVVLTERNLVSGSDGLNVSLPTFQDWQDQATSFTDLAAFGTYPVMLRGGTGVASRTLVAGVSPDLFSILQVRPVAGRLILPEDDQIGATPVVILRESEARDRFGSAAGAVGRSVSLSGSTAEVVGVLPSSFGFPNDEVRLWSPVVATNTRPTERNVHTLTGIARLRPGVTLDAAAAEMSLIAERIQQANPGEDPDHGASVQRLHDQVVGDARNTLFVLLGAVGFVLLIASANVADLTLARVLTRRRELAVRTALGATRGRLARQLMVESMVLAGIGGILALVFSTWGIDILTRLLSGTIPRVESVTLSGPVLLFTFFVTLAAGAMFGVLPALRGVSGDLHDALRGRIAGSPAGIRARSVLAVGQVAVTMVLLTGAGLMVKSFLKLQDTDPGFDPAGMLSMTVSLSGTSHAQSNEDVIEYFRDLRERIRAVPGVVNASGVNSLPISGGDSGGQITIEGRTLRNAEEPSASYRRILPGYFDTMRIPLIAGRDFDARDGIDRDSAVIISAAMAQRYWPEGGAVGARIKIGPPEYEPWLTIVGVAGDVRNVGLTADPGFATYEPHQQRVWRTLHMVVRTTVDPASVVPAVRNAIRGAGVDVPIYNITTLPARISGSVTSQRLNMTLLATFAVLALVLAAVGLYGVIAYSVQQRTREFGIRLAVGARGSDLVLAVVKQGTVLIGTGVVIGLAGAVALTGAIRGLLYDVAPTDPVTYALVSALLLAVAMVASWIPARRAVRADPMDALRYD